MLWVEERSRNTLNVKKAAVEGVALRKITTPVKFSRLEACPRILRTLTKGLTNSTELSNLDVSEILQKANSVLFCDGEVFEELNNGDNSHKDDISFTHRATSSFSLNIFYSTEIQYTCLQTIQYIRLKKIIPQKWIGTEAKLIEFLSNFRLLYVQVTLFCYFSKRAA